MHETKLTNCNDHNSVINDVNLRENEPAEWKNIKLHYFTNLQW